MYGVRLADWYAGRSDLTPRELSVLVHQLPPGSMLWRGTGGPMAWSDEVTAAMLAVYRLEVLAWQQTEDGHKNRRPPKPPVPPPPAAEAQAAAEAHEAKADLWEARRAARAKHLAEQAVG